MQIIQTIAGTRTDHGGTSRSVPAICDALASLGSDVHLVTGKTPGVDSNLPSPPVSVHLIPESSLFGRSLTGRKFAGQLNRLYAAAPKRCIVHDHGIWLPSNRATAKAARNGKWIRVVSPRGMVSKWALNHGSRGKRIAWKLFQEKDLKSATAFHATSELEANELRDLGLNQPIAVIPNGIDLPEQMPTRQRVSGKNRMVFMSRVHPKKGLLNLVQAWKLADVSQHWELLIVGPDEGGHRSEVANAVEEASLKSCVHFHDEVGDDEKWQLLVDSDMFVLPSFSENFGIVVAEALATGLPVITTTGTPWEEITAEEIGWWVEPSVDSLRSAIEQACSKSSPDRAKMSQRAISWSNQRFCWRQIGARMLHFYQWLSDDAPLPECVRTT